MKDRHRLYGTEKQMRNFSPKYNKNRKNIGRPRPRRGEREGPILRVVEVSSAAVGKSAGITRSGSSRRSSTSILTLTLDTLLTTCILLPRPFYSTLINTDTVSNKYN